MIICTNGAALKTHSVSFFMLCHVLFNSDLMFCFLIDQLTSPLITRHTPKYILLCCLATRSYCIDLLLRLVSHMACSLCFLYSTAYGHSSYSFVAQALDDMLMWSVLYDACSSAPSRWEHILVGKDLCLSNVSCPISNLVAVHLTRIHPWWSF